MSEMGTAMSQTDTALSGMGTAKNQARILVVGAGPAGLAAAAAASRHGCAVTLIDDNDAVGGQIWRSGIAADGTKVDAGGSRRRRLVAEMLRNGVRILGNRRLFNVDAGGTAQLLQENASGAVVEEVAFDKLILATGARERFLPFPGWTLPGIYGAGGLQALVRAGLPIEDRRVVVAGTGPLLMAVAAHLKEAGAAIPVIAEQARMARLARFGASLWRQPSKLLQGAGYGWQLRKTPFRTGTWVVAAHAGETRGALRSVTLTNGVKTWEEPCDLLAYGYHLVPNTDVASLLGCAFAGAFVQVDRTQQTSVPNVYCVGEPTGIAGLESALLQGEIAGLVCAGQPCDALQRRAAVAAKFAARLEKAFALRPELAAAVQPETIVCRCEDVTYGRLQPYTSWTDAKLQTRCGMGPCQGRICGPSLDFLKGWSDRSVRPPLFPVPMQALGHSRTKIGE